MCLDFPNSQMMLDVSATLGKIPMLDSPRLRGSNGAHHTLNKLIILL